MLVRFEMLQFTFAGKYVHSEKNGKNPWVHVQGQCEVTTTAFWGDSLFPYRSWG